MMVDTIDKVQKKWIINLFLFPIIYGVLYIFFLEFFIKSLPKGFSSEKVYNFDISNMKFFEAFFFSLLTTPFIYYFSYKKFGTKLLSVLNYLSYASIGYMFYNIHYCILLIKMINNFSDNHRLNYLCIYIMVVNFIVLVLTVFWIINCHRLKKFNFQKQVQILMNIESYKNIFDKLNKIDKIDELTTYFYKIIEENLEIKSLLKKILKKRIKELNSLTVLSNDL
ncbi:MAG: hypothetical protein A3F40_04490 [Chlamydiae bacterium RIFCSPHIGHO2_12_FULL_27_8]|nr:MAG: hypothetical protein A3F40_04490 [Chlamydiae bacterium RIFCSPHIGHO2_12_FULL_27_8]OGN65780.1 MAG: hypothetical protein A2888_00110 [Chlamydiae bacterium RIFCSPLOWO2_01_FULL_28_7]